MTNRTRARTAMLLVLLALGSAHAQDAAAGLKAEPPAAAPAQAPRRVGLHLGLTGSLAVDVHSGRFYAFANLNFLFLLASVSSTNVWVATALGAGISMPVEPGSRWHVDLFGQLLPLHVGGAYTYLGLGVGAGFRYASPTGFTVSFKLPVLGVAARTGTSPTGYDSTFRPSDAFGYYYLSGALGLPMVAFGYRF